MAAHPGRPLGSEAPTMTLSSVSFFLLLNDLQTFGHYGVACWSKGSQRQFGELI